MKLPDGFLDELRARTPLASLVGRRVRLARAGRNWKGCCPFHGEKTPSFYVYDDHYHCFGCGEHGDAIGFVMKSHGMAFPDAVQVLASEAGLDVPKPAPADSETERRRAGWHAVLDAAARFYQRRLELPEGREAREYLRRRGLTRETIERFGLGWSGDGRGGLVGELGRAGIAREQLAEAGLLRASEEPGAGRELFYNRVIFPIRDRRGQVISFGGRTMGDGQPKYVNGPETKLFSKRHTLYGLDFARDAVRRDATVVVVEGYMDVIALHQAGFGGGVAPLGTALTAEQLGELWRLSPAPVLCFDGDAAGGRAAARAAELALPLLAPDRSLRIAALPTGDDPDTLVGREGHAGFAARLETARPLAEVLFDLLHEGVGETPEQRAAFRGRLEDAAGRIPDRTLASEYRRTLLDRYFASRRSARPKVSFGAARPVFQKPAEKRPQVRPVPSGATASAERIGILFAILLRHPGLLPDVQDAFAGLDLPAPLQRLRSVLLQWASVTDPLDSAGLMTHLTDTGLAAEAAQALLAVTAPLPACAAADAMPAEAEAGWWHFFALMHPERLDDQVSAARDALCHQFDPDGERRLKALCTARDAVRRGDYGNEAEP